MTSRNGRADTRLSSLALRLGTLSFGATNYVNDVIQTATFGSRGQPGHGDKQWAMLHEIRLMAEQIKVQQGADIAQKLGISDGAEIYAVSLMKAAAIVRYGEDLAGMTQAFNRIMDPLHYRKEIKGQGEVLDLRQG